MVIQNNNKLEKIAATTRKWESKKQNTSNEMQKQNENGYQKKA